MSLIDIKLTGVRVRVAERYENLASLYRRLEELLILKDRGLPPELPSDPAYAIIKQYWPGAVEAQIATVVTTIETVQQLQAVDLQLLNP